VVRSAAQAQQGAPVDAQGVAGFVGNAWHDYMALDVLQRTVLPMLDGRQGEEELVAALLQETQAGRLQFLNQGQPITDAAQLQRSAREQLRAALQALRHKALLMVNQE
jgi:methyltransferase-like protein